MLIRMKPRTLEEMSRRGLLASSNERFDSAPVEYRCWSVSGLRLALTHSAARGEPEIDRSGPCTARQCLPEAGDRVTGAHPKLWHSSHPHHEVRAERMRMMRYRILFDRSFRAKSKLCVGTQGSACPETTQPAGQA